MLRVAVDPLSSVSIGCARYAIGLASDARCHTWSNGPSTVTGSRHIELKKLEFRMIRQMQQVPPRSCDQIVNRHNAVAVRQQPVAQMGPDESSSPRNQMTQRISPNCHILQ